MRWFDGNIAEAVTKSKAMNAIFIVFVEGADEMSRELCGVLETPAVSSRLEDKDKFLSVRVGSNSENYTHFAQIYQLVPVPSLFFIGRDGAPLEVVCGGITSEKLSERIDNVVRQYYKTPSDLNLSHSSPGTSSASSSRAFLQAETQAQSKQEQSKNKQDHAQIKQEQAQNKQEQAQPSPSQADSGTKTATPADEKKKETAEDKSNEGPSAPKQAKTDSAEYEVVCDGDVCVRRPKSVGSTSAGLSTEQMVTEAPPGEQPSLDARLDRARELLEAKRREKEAREKELEKEKELERRAAGQSVVQLKRWQQEQELKEAAEERRKERLANELARQRVLEQIAQDRAERKARLQSSPVADQSSPVCAAPIASSSPPASGQVRIQLKLPNGESHAVSFDAEATLADVHAYVRNNKLVQSGGFTLWTLFPRCELPDVGESVTSRGLAPSAALLVLPAGEGAPAVPQPALRIYALISTLLTTMILNPLSNAWSWLSARLFPHTTGRAPTDGASGTSPTSGASGTTLGGATGTSPARGGATGTSPNIGGATGTSPTTGGAGLRYRATSNIHRLREDRSDEDENNTWNGNSTQQM